MAPIFFITLSPEKSRGSAISALAQDVDALMAVSNLLMSRVAPYRGEGRLSRVVQNGVDLSLVPNHEKEKAAQRSSPSAR